MSARAGGDELCQLAAFRIGSEEYAIDILRIHQIIQPLKITKVPKAPKFIEGVVELRGAILPVVDLRKRFDVRADEGRAQKYIIVSVAGRAVGLVVDAVSHVLRVPRAEIRPAPEFGFAGPDASCFSGACRQGDRILLVLDLDRLFSSSERAELGGAPVLAPGGKDEA